MIHTFSSTIRRKEMDAVLTCMVDEKVGPGDISRKLTAAAGEFFGAAGTSVFRSPYLALVYALRALDIPAGSSIAVSALAPSWHFDSVVRCGCTPVVLDVLPDTAQIPADSLSEAVKNGARLILLYEPLGLVPDMEAVLSTGIPVIEDISQSAGSFFAGARAGSFGVFAILGLEERDALTAGGGAMLLASKKRDSVPLKKHTENAPDTDILPDINSALAYIQLREFAKNEARRKEIYDIFLPALMQGRHKTFPSETDCERAAYCFAVVLESGFKDVKQYAAKKGIEIEQAFVHSVAAVYPEAVESCANARSLLMRTAFFPLYPRLKNADVQLIRKALSTLP
jgi:dTDP-4-amino-4,6-dideoxygalactose transaminase